MRFNTPMEHTHDPAQRLTELEIKAGFAEDLLEQLNQIVVRQQVPAGGAGAPRSLRDDLPPHY